ncbi:Bug family tripartite tricarboxylate transporter substrate binding protein [Paracoccus pantotrophus]|uniref:Bug family tripartite tricarboxylate transporter substrate binding protein n=1 Tax=Paracoccus pantotrophus TaxID=82367 RepID=UPI0004B49629|nr:tripartite tricarboxylate transporter substrate binding protein [Paracoccus pantotrophus]
MHKGLLVAAALRAGMASAALAEYPEKPVRIIVGYAAGGGTDLTARLVAEHLSRQLGQPVVIENRPGGGGVVGRQYVAASKPDGYTLLIDSSSFAGYPVFTASPLVDVQRDFEPLSLLNTNEVVLVADANSPFRNLAELAQYAKEHPGELNFASNGPGVTLLSLEAIKDRFDIDIVKVEYKSSSEAYVALLAGEVDLGIWNLSRIRNDVAAGKAIPVAVSGRIADDALKGIENASEVYDPGLVIASYNALYGPAGLPDEVESRLAEALQAIKAEPELQSQLAALDQEPVFSDAATLAERRDADIANWSAIAQKAGIAKQ